MAGLTVAEVAGIVAFATAIVSFLAPNLIALLFAAFVGHEKSAVTWSVVGREIQSSNWPLLLRSDTTASSDVPLSISLLGWLQKLSLLLVTVAGIVTPLGIRSEIQLETSPCSVTFTPISDLSPMGQGTPPRDEDAFFNRVCSNFETYGTCPFSDTKVVDMHWNGTYDVRIPYETAEIFSSFHDELPQTVSGAFDLQWRQYSYSTNPEFNFGEPYQVGVYRPLDTLILDDKVEPIEGLIVDTQNGGIALRNHTGPADTELGGEWSEELLFISPETVCVDTNLTYDFQIRPIGQFSNYSSAFLVNLSLTDRGGFINLNQTYPEPSASGLYAGQRELDLHFRAYKGAWINNAWSMLFFNVTNPAVGRYDHAFNYLDTHMGKKFWLDPTLDSTAAPNLLRLSPYGAYIPYSGYYDIEGSFHRYNSSTPFTDPRAVYSNPFRISNDNFTMANLLCQGEGGEDKANISNVAVACGLMFGAATRTDGQKSLVFTPGTWWTQSIYSCATALKADIKHVYLRWNSSADPNPLDKLQIKNVRDKTYDSKADEPYWAVENLHRDLINMNPLWGLTSSAMAKRYESDKHFNISHSPRLYVPGYAGVDYSSLDPSGSDTNNLATADAITDGLSHLYEMDAYSSYSGAFSLSLFRKWQNLSGDVQTAAKVPNLIWTDLMANALVGTRSWLSPNGLPKNIQQQPRASKNSILQRDTNADSAPAHTQLPIYLYRSRITYKWLYAIPAMLTLTVVVLILLIVLSLTIVGKMVGPRTLTRYLNWTSAGRLLVLLKEQSISNSGCDSDHAANVANKSSSSDSAKAGLFEETPEVQHIHTSSAQWIKSKGRRMINLDTISGAHKLSNPSTQSRETPEYQALISDVRENPDWQQSRETHQRNERSRNRQSADLANINSTSTEEEFTLGRRSGLS